MKRGKNVKQKTIGIKKIFSVTIALLVAMASFAPLDSLADTGPVTYSATVGSITGGTVMLGVPSGAASAVAVGTVIAVRARFR